MSIGCERINVQLSNYFSKAAEHLLNKTEVIHVSQEEISSRILEAIDCSRIKSESLGLCKSNSQIVACTDGYGIQAFWR